MELSVLGNRIKRDLDYCFTMNEDHLCRECFTPLTYKNHEYVCPECGWVEACEIEDNCMGSSLPGQPTKINGNVKFFLTRCSSCGQHNSVDMTMLQENKNYEKKCEKCGAIISAMHGRGKILLDNGTFLDGTMDKYIKES